MDTSKLIDSMKRIVKSELGSYDTTAEVRRIEDGTAWVHIPGGVDETPVKLTMNASVGDNVQVRVSDGKAFLAGNVSAPPTDDTTAEAAKALANRAAEDAGRAKSAADIAESYATSAQASAAQSANILEGMEQAAIAAGTTLDGIYADAVEAKATTDEINDYADTAGKTVTQILDDGETAGAAAQAASEAANSALVGLSTVEDVVGVLNWITEHGTMTNTQDLVPPETVIDPSHVYFVQDDVTPGDYHVGAHYYAIVSEPKQADIASYYLLSVDESVQNYVATHVAVDTEGLWLIPENNATPASSGKKILIATGAGSTYTTAGTYIIEKVGGTDTVLASFTASGATIGETVNGNSRAEIGTDGMRIIQKENGSDTEISHLGYGLCQFSNGSTGNAPYYTFGSRLNIDSPGVYTFSTSDSYALGDFVKRNGSLYVANNDVSPGPWNNADWSDITLPGNFSVAEGGNNASANSSTHAEGIATVSMGFESSHSEGWRTIAAGTYGTHAEGMASMALGEYGAHAEGYLSKATGNYGVHAEGTGTEASGTSGAHAEGYGTTASGNSSHSQNEGTIAQRKSQTALGEYNIADTTGADGTVRGDYSLIIGNGTADNARSNALTVDWSGNVEAAGNVNIASGAKYKINGTALSASDVGALAEDANGDVSITRNITAGGSVDIASGESYKINGTAIDYIIDQGTSSGWTYRKWANGLSECWGNFGISYVTGGSISTAFPTGLFISKPTVTKSLWYGNDTDANRGVRQVIITDGSSNANSITYVRKASDNGAYTGYVGLTIHAIGSWQ